MIISETLPRVALMLQDPSMATYNEQVITDGLNAGLDAVLPWASDRKVFVPTAGSVSELTLPSDIYRILSVYDGASGYFIPESAMLPSQRPGNNQQSQNAWVYLSSKLMFFSSLEASKLQVIYEAQWPHFGDLENANYPEDEVVAIPRWAERAVEYYACYYCYLSKAGATGSVRQYNIQVDSGNPSHNPLADMAKAYHDAFYSETKLFPVPQKGQRT